MVEGNLEESSGRFDGDEDVKESVFNHLGLLILQRRRVTAVIARSCGNEGPPKANMSGLGTGAANGGNGARQYLINTSFAHHSGKC